MDSYRQPEFLTDKDKPLFRIRCPIHGFIHFSANERRIVDHWIFQRLRFIRQLALTELIYPGATHTRFEHSFGVLEMATRSFDSLATKHGGLLETRFRDVAAIRDHPMGKARQVLRLAALLHDIGHVCFSHAAEKVIFKGGDHEGFSQTILRQKDLLGGMLDGQYWEGCAELVADVLKGVPSLVPQLLVLHDIVSGQMDADRGDYLLRDSLHCGVDYGRFDFRRLIESLELFEDDELGRLEIALNRDGVHAFEALILARYQMNTQVYYHRLRRIYDYYLTQYLKALDQEAQLNRDTLATLAHNDTTMMASILHDARQSSGERAKWARRIFERNHHRAIHETGEKANYKDIDALKHLMKSMKERFPDVELIDDVCDVSIHRLAIPEDTDATGKVRMRLLGPVGSIIGDVGEQSQVLATIPREFQCGRIYADIAGNGALGSEMRQFAKEKWTRLGGRS